MESARDQRPANDLTILLAGLQAGMVAAFWMLVWLGISAMWMHRSFWSPANIMATSILGDRAIHPGLASTTPSGPQTPGVSGATELGDGRLVLILDVAAVSRTLRARGTSEGVAV